MKDNGMPFAKKLEIVTLAGLLCLLPFTGMTSVKEILFFSLAGLFLAGRLPDFRNMYRESLHYKTLHILMIASSVLALVSLLHAIDPSYTFREAVTKMPKQYLLYVFAFFLVRDAGAEKVPWILYPLALSATVMSLYACYQFYENPAFFVNRVTGFTGAFYRLSTLLVLSFPLVMILAFHSHGWMRNVIFLSIPFLLAALFFTFTRGAWIAVIVETGILIAFFLRRFTKTFLGIIAAVFLAVMTLSYQSVISPTLLTRGSEQPRIEAVRLSADIIRKYPFTGIGYGKETFSKYYPDTYVKHAHNILLNTVVETGIIGGALFVAMMAVLLKTFIRGIRKETVFERKVILSGIFASFAGFLCLNTFDYMYHGWPGQMFWALIGIGLALITESQKCS